MSFECCLGREFVSFMCMESHLSTPMRRGEGDCVLMSGR